MSEYQQQNFEDFIKNLNDELYSIDQKYSNETDNENCTKCLEKLTVYTRCTTHLLNNCYGRHSSQSAGEIESVPRRSNANIHDDMNLVRTRLEHRIQMDEQAIDSLSQGRHEQFVVQSRQIYG